MRGLHRAASWACRREVRSKVGPEPSGQSSELESGQNPGALRAAAVREGEAGWVQSAGS